jgi:hypothetical protein
METAFATPKAALWQPLGFFSKKLSKTEVNYSTFDQELLAAVSAIKHFRSRLKGCPFQLWTDHKPLIFALNRVSPLTSGRQQRHLAFISEYTNQQVYVPGTSNVVADALSLLAAVAAGTVLVCTETFGDRFSNTSTGPPTLAGGRSAASSPPGLFGTVSPQMSPPGQRPA